MKCTEINSVGKQMGGIQVGSKTQAPWAKMVENRCSRREQKVVLAQRRTELVPFERLAGLERNKFRSTILSQLSERTTI